MMILEKRLGLDGPRNDDELHAWILKNVGIDIPRTAVCEDHVAPFTFFSDMYFDRKNSALVMANRGGSKTFLVALLHYMKSKFRAEIECATIGAIEMQARRAYQHLNTLIDKLGREDIVNSTATETRWKNGSKVEILPGTMNAVNGPHPQVVHADEVELMDQEVFDESRNMSASKRIGTNVIPAQDIITSTRKRANGPMQRLVDEVNDALNSGLEPSYWPYPWCIFECAEEQKNCQVANPNMQSCDSCDCDRVTKGYWDDGTPRTLKEACNGKLAKSRGWTPMQDIVKTFTKTSRFVWEAQQECIRPSTTDLVLQNFATQTHGIRRYEPDPENGPIYAGIDFGGQHPHSVEWFQVLEHEVEVSSSRGDKIRMPQGSYVIFDELYISNIGNGRLAEKIAEEEKRWKVKYPSFRIEARFADPQGRAARIDLARADTPIKTQWWLPTRDRKPQIEILKELVDDKMLFVDVERCPMWVEEAENWHYPKKKADMSDDPELPVKDFDHAMDSSRYGIANVHSHFRTNSSTQGSVGLPRSKGRSSSTLPASNGSDKDTAWMKQFI